MRIVVKVGGAQLEQAGPRAELARGIANAQAAGHEIVLVHGGGNQIRALCTQLGIVERQHEGLRVTDAATADVVTMVLAGLVNKALVLALEDEGVRAAGVSGVDGNSFSVRKTEASVDLGYVGTVVRVERGLALTLLDTGYVPVVATVAALAQGESGARDHLYNVNADTAAAPLARALEADALVFLTDVPGVLDAEKRRIPELTARRAAELRASGVITGGMIPKVAMALAASAELPHGLVKIAPAAGESALLRALESSTGTRFTQESTR